MSLSNYLENKLVDLVVNGVAYAGQSTVYTKLHTGDPGEDGTANAAGETTRKATTFGASSGGVALSDADVTWTNVSTSETYSHVSQWDALSGGNCLGSGPMTTPKAVVAGDNFTLPAGDISFGID